MRLLRRDQIKIIHRDGTEEIYESASERRKLVESFRDKKLLERMHKKSEALDF